ncbi:hypothetical protein J6590_091367, partial [Homalodisca vitripennis]
MSSPSISITFNGAVREEISPTERVHSRPILDRQFHIITSPLRQPEVNITACCRCRITGVVSQRALQSAALRQLLTATVAEATARIDSNTGLMVTG